MNLPTPDMCPGSKGPDPRGEMMYLPWVIRYLSSNIQRFFEKKAVRGETTQTMEIGRRYLQPNWYTQLVSTNEFRCSAIFAMNQRMASTGWQIAETEVQWEKDLCYGVCYSSEWRKVRKESEPSATDRAADHRQILTLTFEYTAPQSEAVAKDKCTL